MTPHDERAPYRNQRWIECKSADGGSYEFGDCVRIYDSQRPEEGHQLVPGGARTLFTVGTPIEDNEANTIILGHLNVSGATKLGYCTNDFPAYAKVDSSAQVGDEVGPVAGTTTLYPGYQGYLVMGDVRDGMARVRRKDAAASHEGTILFKMLTDRTRETDAAGKYFGRATAVVQDLVGVVPVSVGDIVEVIFGDRRWLGAVGNQDDGCEGIADFYTHNGEGKWIVKECQELTAFFWFKTKERRDPDAADQDVDVDVLKNVGHANADFPAELWKVLPPTQCSGSALWTSTNAVWLLTTPCSPGCQPLQDPNDLIFAPPPFEGQTFSTPCTGTLPGADVKVRFYDLTFPYAFENAIGLAVLDVDINNVQDNSTMRYYVVQVDQGALINEVFHAQFCPGEEPDVSSHEPATFYPFGMKWPDELIQTALDRMDLASKNGGTGWTAYSHVLRQHVILNTTHEEYEFLQEGQGCAFNKLKIQALTCKDPEASTTFTFDDVLTDVELAFTTETSGSGPGSTCQNPTLDLNYKTRKALVCGAQSGFQNASTLALALQDAVVDMDMTGCPTWVNAVFVVFATCGEASESADCEPCPSGSG